MPVRAWPSNKKLLQTRKKILHKWCLIWNIWRWFTLLEADGPCGKQVPWVPSNSQFAKPSVGYRLLCKHSDRRLKWLLAAHHANILQLLAEFSSCPLPAYQTFIHVITNLCALSCNKGHCEHILSLNLIQTTLCTKWIYSRVCVHYTLYTCARFHLSEQLIRKRWSTPWPPLTKNKCCPSRMSTQSFA